MYRGPIFFPLVLVVLGFLLLFSNLGYIQFDFWQFITTWWPLLLIIGGLDILIGSLRARNVKARTLALDLGTAAQADVSINFGAGDLTIGKAAPGKIVDGTFEGEVRYDAKPDGRVWLKLEPLNWWGWNPRGYRWNVGLTDAVPLKLTLDGGAANTNADLTDLKVTDLRVKTGREQHGDQVAARGRNDHGARQCRRGQREAHRAGGRRRARAQQHGNRIERHQSPALPAQRRRLRLARLRHRAEQDRYSVRRRSGIAGGGVRRLATAKSRERLTVGTARR